jgi:hypothetical protein
MLVVALFLLAAPSPLLDRELPKDALHLYPFKSADGTLAGEAEATAPPTVTGDHVELKLGEAADPIDCEVVRGRIEPATRAYRALEEFKKADLTTMEPSVLEVSVWSEAPLLTFDLLYAKGIAQGEFKLAMLVSDGVSFACSQDTAGFRASFRTAVLSLASTLRDPRREVPPRTFHQIELLKADGALAGFDETVVQEMSGGLLERRYRTLIAQSAPGALRTTDSESRLVVGAGGGGSVEQGDFAVVAGNVGSEARLSRGKGGRYVVSGKRGGKPFETSFAAPDGLATAAAVQHAARDLLANKIDARKFQRLDPEKPGSPTTFTLRRDPARAGGLLLESKGAPPVRLEVDPGGRSRKSEMGDRGRRLTSETLLVTGSLN